MKPIETGSFREGDASCYNSNRSAVNLAIWRSSSNYTCWPIWKQNIPLGGRRPASRTTFETLKLKDTTWKCVENIPETVPYFACLSHIPAKGETIDRGRLNTIEYHGNSNFNEIFTDLMCNTWIGHIGANHLLQSQNRRVRGSLVLFDSIVHCTKTN